MTFINHRQGIPVTTSHTHTHTEEPPKYATTTTEAVDKSKQNMRRACQCSQFLERICECFCEGYLRLLAKPFANFCLRNWLLVSGSLGPSRDRCRRLSEECHDQKSSLWRCRLVTLWHNIPVVMSSGCSWGTQARTQDFGQEGPTEFWFQGGTLTSKFAQDRGFPLKIAWKLHDFEEILGARGAWAPRAPWIRYWRQWKKNPVALQLTQPRCQRVLHDSLRWRYSTWPATDTINRDPSFNPFAQCKNSIKGKAAQCKGIEWKNNRFEKKWRRNHSISTIAAAGINNLESCFWILQLCVSPFCDESRSFNGRYLNGR